MNINAMLNRLVKKYYREQEKKKNLEIKSEKIEICYRGHPYTKKGDIDKNTLTTWTEVITRETYEMWMRVDMLKGCEILYVTNQLT